MTARKIKNSDMNWDDWDDMINVDMANEILGFKANNTALRWILRNMKPYDPNKKDNEIGYKKFPQYYLISRKKLLEKINEVKNVK